MRKEYKLDVCFSISFPGNPSEYEVEAEAVVDYYPGEPPSRYSPGDMEEAEVIELCEVKCGNVKYESMGECLRSLFESEAQEYLCNEINKLVEDEKMDQSAAHDEYMEREEDYR